MPKTPFTPDQQQEALQRLADNNGDVVRTARDTGIHAATLRRWRDEQTTPPTTWAQTRVKLRDWLAYDALELARNLLDATAPIPLNQRSSALNTVVDKLLKLNETLDDDEAREGTEDVRVVFYDPDGSRHNTPIWEREAPRDADHSPYD